VGLASDEDPSTIRRAYTPVTLGESNKRDIELLKRMQRRDRDALAELYARYSPIVYPLAVRIVGSTEEVGELVQEVFVHVWERAGRYIGERGSVYSWIVAVCRNKGLEKIRARAQKRRPKEGEGNAPRGAAEQPARFDAQDLVALKEYATAIRNTLRAMPKPELRILELSYFDGTSQSDITRSMRMALGTVKSKMRRGIQRLRQAAKSTGGQA
jgi:RNA polymerase sigma-70 factor (ECF subfamily)